MIERFANPWLLLLLVLPVAVLLLRRLLAARRKPTLSVSDTSLLAELAGGGKARLRRVPSLFRYLALILLVLALARPQSGTHYHEVNTDGVDIVLAIDISTSMRGEDFRPRNRLDEAKAQAAEFIERRTHDRVGLVVFARQAYTQCPLTLDHEILLTFLSQVEMGLVEDGTAIGSAIATGTNRLRESEAESKVLVLLTDGDNNAGQIDPQTAARAASAMDVKVYTIGVGKQGKVPYPVEDPFFGRRYQYMETNLDEETLREIASETGGRYFRAENADALARIYEEIDKLEKTEISNVERVDYREASHLFLIPALLLLAIAFLLGQFYLRGLP